MAEESQDFREYDSFDELDNESQGLIQKAEEALELSYSPYSNFQVGAAALLKNGDVIKGANQENASFPAGLCAERVVLFQIGAISPKEEILKLAVVARKNGESSFRGAGPCGFCRQVMLEFEQKQQEKMEVLFLAKNQKWIKTESATVLLPFAFGKDNL